MRSSQGDKPNKPSGGSAKVLKYIWSQFGKISIILQPRTSPLPS